MQPTPLRRVVAQTQLRDQGSRYPKTSSFGSLVKQAVFVALSIVAFCCAVPVAHAAGQTNDFCSGAENIPGNAGALSPYYTSVKDTSLTTTNGDPARTCQQFVARGVWYSFTPNASAIYTISSCNDPNAPTATTIGDTVMAIYQSTGGCGGPFVEIDCNDDACGPGDALQSSITRQLFADTSYYIVVWQYFDPSDPPPGGNLQLRLTRAIRPPNDTCATPIQVPLNFPVSGTTIGGDNNYQLPAGGACFTGVGQVASTAPGRDVVFAFTAPRDGEYNFKVYNYSIQNNLVVYVAGSCPSSGTPVTVTTCLGAANRSSASSAEEVICVPLAANQRVLVFVDEHGFTAGSSFTFEVNPCYREREPNNAWTNASVIACGITGTIQPGSDIDWFQLGRPAAGSRAFVLLDGEAAGTTDFDLRLTTTSDTLEYDDQDNDGAFGSFSPNIAGAILPGGGTAVYARVDFRGLPTEPYHLYAVVQPPMSAAFAEVEPNATAAQATFAEIQYYQGALAGPAPSTDVDMFMFTAEGSELVFVSLDGDPLRNNTPINARLELIDEFGNILVTADDENSLSSTNSGAGNLTSITPRSPGEGFVHRIVNDGTYFVRVTISSGTVGPTGAGDYLLSISKNCYTGSSGFANTPPAVTVAAEAPIFENDTAVLNGDIVDADSWQPHQVIINWGDGSAPTTNYLAPGLTGFSIEHDYLDDNPTSTTSDLYPVQVSVTDGWGGSGNGNGSIRVSNAPPVLNTLSITSPISPNDTATLEGTFSDAGTLDTFTLSVNWGDGTPIQNANYPAGAASFMLTHQYTAAGSNTVSVTLGDDDGGTQLRNLGILIQSNGGAPATLRSLVRAPNGIVTVRLEGTPGASYHLEYSSNLSGWTALPAQTADSNGVILFQDVSAVGAPQRFYRGVSP